MKSTTKQASTTESSFKTPARAPERELVPEFRSCTPKKKTERTFLPPQVDVQEVSYLGQKGYTLPKSAFTPDQLDQLKESLIARPMVMGGMLQTCPVYPIYRESEKNIYMPRYFGIQHYGPPKECQLPEGDPIDVPFRGTLRDHQLPAVQAYMDLVQQPHQRHAAGLLELNCASGKCLGKDETVLMFDGTIKCVQEVRLGDVLMGDDSTPRRVLSLAKGRDVLYRISDPYGGSYVVNRSHILSLKWVESRYQVNKGDILDVNVLDVLRYPKTYRGLLSPLRGFRVPIEFPAVSVPMDPYMIGYMFGGSSKDEPTKSIDGVKRVEPLCGSERFLDSLSRIPEGNPTTNDLRSSTDFGGVFSFHSLESTWSMYYHLPQDKNWTLLSYVPIMEKIDTVEKLIAVNECIPDNVIKYCMLFVMKEGITPMWEDINNRTGGCFSYKVINRVVPAVWRELMYLLGGNVLTINPEHMNFVNGITISPKKNFSIVKIWMLDCSLQDPACIKPILNLVKNGCMFRKHEPEF